MGQGTLVEVRDGSGEPPGVLRRVIGHLGSYETGQWTLGEVRNGSRDLRGGPGRVRGPSWRSGTCRGNHPNVLDG